VCVSSGGAIDRWITTINVVAGRVRTFLFHQVNHEHTVLRAFQKELRPARRQYRSHEWLRQLAGVKRPQAPPPAGSFLARSGEGNSATLIQNRHRDEILRLRVDGVCAGFDRPTETARQNQRSC
jgi:hypothetical protein